MTHVRPTRIHPGIFWANTEKREPSFSLCLLCREPLCQHTGGECLGTEPLERKHRGKGGGVVTSFGGLGPAALAERGQSSPDGLGLARVQPKSSLGDLMEQCQNSGLEEPTLDSPGPGTWQDVRIFQTQQRFKDKENPLLVPSSGSPWHAPALNFPHP